MEKNLLMKTNRPFDFLIFIPVFILVLFGVVMILSSSSASAYTIFGDTYFFLRSQLFNAFIGFIVLLIAMNIDYKNLRKVAPILLVLAIVFLILVRIPGIGSNIKGSWRWIHLGPLSFQPSEFAKFVIILFFSFSLSKKPNQLSSFKNFLSYIVLIGIFSILLILEPHLSCTIIIILTTGTILFCAGAKLKHFLITIIPTVIVLIITVAFNPYMQSRIQTFMGLNSDNLGDSWQISQSLIAIGSGGFLGKGLGRSIQKYLFLPEPQNDFIFSIIAEELGFIGVVFVLLMFSILIWRGIKIAATAEDLFGTLLATGITTIIAIQLILNIAVVTHSIPTTGVSLPFISAGGTSLLFLMGSVGILLNISKHANYERI